MHVVSGTKRLTPILTLTLPLTFTIASFHTNWVVQVMLAMLSSSCIHEPLHRFNIHSRTLFICRLAAHFVLSPNSRNALTHSSSGYRWHATSLYVMAAEAHSTVMGAKWQLWFIWCYFPGKCKHSNPLKKLTHSLLRQLQINFNLEVEIWIHALYPSCKPGITDNGSVPTWIISDMIFLLPKNAPICLQLF